MVGPSCGKFRKGGSRAGDEGRVRCRWKGTEAAGDGTMETVYYMHERVPGDEDGADEFQLLLLLDVWDRRGDKARQACEID